MESCFTEYIFFSETFCSRELNYFLDNVEVAAVTGAAEEAGQRCQQQQPGAQARSSALALTGAGGCPHRCSPRAAAPRSCSAGRTSRCRGAQIESRSAEEHDLRCPERSLPVRPEKTTERISSLAQRLALSQIFSRILGGVSTHFETSWKIFVDLLV